MKMIKIKSHFKAFRALFTLLIFLSGYSAAFAQPANDEPCNATTLTASTSCTYFLSTNDLATGSANVPDPGCASYLGGDVWFSVVVPSGGALSFDTQEGTMTDGGMAIYSGTCNNLTLIDCDDDGGAGLMPYILAGGLTPGSTIWIRMWDYGGFGQGTFGICVTIPPPPPANDEPCNAIPINYSPTCNYQYFTNESATGTSAVADPGCAFYSGGDVWFYTIVPAGGSVQIDTKDSVMLDGGMAVYSGSCGTLTLIDCNDNSSPNGSMPQITRNNLTPGDTLWIRVWAYGNTGNGFFGICVSTPPPAPSNDEPCNAITITSGPTCNYQIFSNESSTASSNVPAPGCANYVGGDVWFKIKVPCGGSLTFDTQDGGITDGGMAIYSGTCDNLTLIECDDDDSPNGLMSSITRTDFTPGDTIWVRIWEYGGDNNGTFGLCVTVPPPSGPGGSCQTASAFCTSTAYVFNNNTNVPSLGGGGIYGCLSTTPNPVWYYMQIQNPGDISITINQTSSTGTPIDVDFAVWGPFSSLAATCGGISANNIIDCSYSTAATEVADITNAQAGQFYMMLITNYANQVGTINFQQTGGTASTNCAVICSVFASSTAPVCNNSTFTLSATTVPGGNYSWIGPDCFTATGQTPSGIVPPHTPGDYTYTVTAVSDSGSTCIGSTVVTVNGAPELGPDSSQAACNISSVNLYNIFDTTGVTSAWTTGGIPVSTPASVSTPGAFQLIATNTIGCKDTAIFNLSISQVTASASTQNANCSSNGQITINNPTGANPITYSINTSPTVFQNNPVFSAPQGNYTITIKDANNCLGTVPAVVGFSDNLQLQASADDSLCSGNSVTISATGNAASYSWSPSAGLSSSSIASPIASPTSTTNYTVTATLGSCTKTENVRVVVFPAVTVDAGPTQTIFLNGSATLQATASGATQYLWTPSAGLSSNAVLNPVATPSSTTLYTLTASNSNGCSATDTVTVIVVPYCINVRNAFSPNGDGTNDLWAVYDSYSCLRNVTVHVYNRYGNKVFESRDYKNDWDGRYNGKPSPDGTYYAVIEFTLYSGKTFTKKTDLTIIR